MRSTARAALETGGPPSVFGFQFVRGGFGGGGLRVAPGGDLLGDLRIAERHDLRGEVGGVLGAGLADRDGSHQETGGIWQWRAGREGVVPLGRSWSQAATGAKLAIRSKDRFRLGEWEHAVPMSQASATNSLSRPL